MRARLARAALRRLLYRTWPSILSGGLIVAGYTAIDNIEVFSRFDHELVTLAFIAVAVVILIPVRDYLIEPFLSFPSWDTLLETEAHHLDFLARPFTLQALLKKITPDLLIWLKIPSARLFILQQDRRSYDMHAFREGELVGTRCVSRRRLRPLLGMFRQYGRIARLHDEALPPEVSQVMERYRFAIAVPFLHRGRVMGVLTLRQPTQHRHAERGLELFAAKAAITIHDHILKARMQNIAEYDQELRVAEKIRQMLQVQQPPIVPGWLVRPGQIRSATLVEFYSCGETHYSVLLSMQSGGGVAAMILSGALGTLFAMLRNEQCRLDLASLLARMREYLAANDLAERLEILALALRQNESEAEFEATGGGYHLVEEGVMDLTIARSERTRIDCRAGTSYSLRFHGDEILTISRQGGDDAA